jgi:hypothetical protein
MRLTNEAANATRRIDRSNYDSGFGYGWRGPDRTDRLRVIAWSVREAWLIAVPYLIFFGSMALFLIFFGDAYGTLQNILRP